MFDVFGRPVQGTSSEYRGDSSINVFGDLLSCGFGYALSRHIVYKVIARTLPN